MAAEAAGGASAAPADVDDGLGGSRLALEKVMAAGAVAAFAGIVSAGRQLEANLQISLAVNLGLSVVGYRVTTSCIHSVGEMFMRANLRGIDLNKRTTKRDAAGNLVRPICGIAIPESQGTVCASVYIILMTIFIPSIFATRGLQDKGNDGSAARLTEYLAAILTITLASALGFADDVLDLRWRHKIPVPCFATLPLLLVYYANGGETNVMVPQQLQFVLGESVNFGIFFYLVLLFLAVCSTHVINIYAGVNGLETGQAVIIAISVLILNVVQLHRIPPQYEEYRTQHLHSLFLVTPFLAVSLALMRLNWFPARVFVGDTYCYFAGMTLATICIIGHFSKTMIVFLLPQILNAIYCIPQLVRHIGIPCPRHRMPAFDAATGYVMNSYAEFNPEELPRLGQTVFGLLRRFRLAHILPADTKGNVRMSNLTLINFVLYVFGPCREDILCMRLLAVQVASSCLCFVVRFGFASWLFSVVL